MQDKMFNGLEKKFLISGIAFLRNDRKRLPLRDVKKRSAAEGCKRRNGE
jgi:hypothetical protein